MAIIVIVVAVYTGQEWLAEYGVEAMTATQCTGSYTLASYAAAAAVGSVAGQAVAMALGAQESFSWKGVALAALSAGVGGALPGGEAFGEGIGGTIARAATSSLITQGVSVATGMQEQFSWSGVAATAIGAGLNAGLANSGVGQTLKQSFGDIGGNRLVGTLANGAAHALVFGGKANWTSVAADVFGNVIANELGYRATAVGNAEQSAALDDAEQRAWDQGNEDLYRQGIVPGGGNVEDELPGMGGHAAGNGRSVGMQITAKRGDPLNQSARLIYAEDFASDVLQRQQQYAAFLGTAGSGDDPWLGFSGNELREISAALAAGAPQFQGVLDAGSGALGVLTKPVGAFMDLAGDGFQLSANVVWKAAGMRGEPYPFAGQVVGGVPGALVGAVAGFEQAIGNDAGFITNKIGSLVLPTPQAGGSAPVLYPEASVMKGVLGSVVLSPMSDAYGAAQAGSWNLAGERATEGILGAFGVGSVVRSGARSLLGDVEGVANSAGKTAADNFYFRSSIKFDTSGIPGATGLNYKVFQRSDIDWQMIRSLETGAKPGRGLTNAEAAGRYGLAPVLPDGSIATLHHSQQSAIGPLFEASTRYHNISNIQRAPLHPFGGSPHPDFPLGRGTGSLRDAFQRVDSLQYWKWRGAQELGK